MYQELAATVLCESLSDEMSELVKYRHTINGDLYVTKLREFSAV